MEGAMEEQELTPKEVVEEEMVAKETIDRNQEMSSSSSSSGGGRSDQSGVAMETGENGGGGGRDGNSRAAFSSGGTTGGAEGGGTGVNQELERNRLPEDSRVIIPNRCDCLIDTCPGCHFPCEQCGGPFCGHVCRRGRLWEFEELDIQGGPNTLEKRTLPTCKDIDD